MKVLVKSGLKSEALRVLVIDFSASIMNISLIRTSLVGDDDVRVSIQKKACCTKECQVRGERGKAVEISSPIQFQEFPTNSPPDDQRRQRRYVAGNGLCGRRGVQHHACERMTESRNKAAASAESRPPPIVSRVRPVNSPR